MIHNNLHLALKYSRTFIHRHYLFLEAHGFPRAPFSEQITTLVKYSVVNKWSLFLLITSLDNYQARIIKSGKDCV